MLYTISIFTLMLVSLPQIKAEVNLSTMNAGGGETAYKYCQETPAQSAVACGPPNGIRINGSPVEFPYALSAAGEYTLVADSTMAVEIKMWGAGGGGNARGNRAVKPGSASLNYGGGGGFTKASFTFTAGQVFTAIVGSAGTINVVSDNVGNAHGGNNRVGTGGGFTGLFDGTSVNQGSALLMAGGGGGVGYGDWSQPGAGGGASGQAASYRSHVWGDLHNGVVHYAPCDGSGRGGTHSQGGAGGCDTGRGAAGAGSAMQGGRSAGSNPVGPSSNLFGGPGLTYDCPGGSFDGGGGGGGYYGGGGGTCHWSGSAGGGSGFQSSSFPVMSSSAEMGSYATPGGQSYNYARTFSGADAGTQNSPGLIYFSLD